MSGISRRGLLGAGVFGIVLAPFARAEAAEGATSNAVARHRSRNLYTRGRFKPLRAKRFHLTGPTTRTPVRLVRISDLKSTAHGDEHRFALTLRATKQGPPQGTYTLRRRGFAPTTLFVVPDARRRSYEAVINRAP